MLLLAALSFCSLNAQIINFNDTNFKQKLLDASPFEGTAKDINGNNIEVDINNDDEIEVSEALLVYRLQVNGSSIADMTGLEFFTNLIELQCIFNQLVSLDLSSLTNLEELRCNDNDLIALNINGLSMLKVLNCAGNTIANLNISASSNLEEIWCSSNNLSSLDVTGFSSLTELFADVNQLTSINLAGAINLNWLSVESNELPNLDLTGLINLEYLNCNNNSILNLNASGLPNLVDLNCSDNQIASLDVSGLSNLVFLYAEGNSLTQLDVSDLSSVSQLHVDWNQLSSLNLTGMNSLVEVDCSDNNLSSFVVSGASNLQYIHCENNQLTELDVSSLNLVSIFCNFNNITSLDFSNSVDLDVMVSRFNDLQYIIFKNGEGQQGAQLMEFGDNPSLEYLCVDLFEVPYMQGRLDFFGYTNVHMNDYCSFVPGGEFYEVSGNVLFDFNANGCDINDYPASFFQFDIINGTDVGTIVTDITGEYYIPVQSGTHTITPVFENPAYWTVSPSILTVDFPTDPSPFDQDFCIAANGVHPDLEVVILPTTVARPGFEAAYKIIYSNKGNQTQSGEVTLTYNDLLTEFISANPAFDSQNNNILSWDYLDLDPFESREINLVFEVNSPMDTPPVNNGDELSYASIIYPVSGDDLPEDNAFELMQTVVGSQDPNDKRCLQGETVLPEFPGEYAHYLIRFENIGTFAAENIVVTDNIDINKFDISTLRVLGGSHDFVTRIIENDVEFIFEGINLPFDPANNDGYILFKVRTNSSLELGDTFSNEASIFFDYNFPIDTNNYVTTIEEALGTADFTFDEHFLLYPNPAKQLLNIHTKKDVEIESLEIYNSFGQLILAQMGASEVIQIEKLATGMYFLKIRTNQGQTISEFIKE